MKQFAVRLKPGIDLRRGIEEFAKEHDVRAGFIGAGVGGLKNARLRMPAVGSSKPKFKEFEGPFEVTSITGTVSADGCHIHLTVSDADGAVFGGHLPEGCTVRTTAEIVIVEDETKEFRREPDDDTGYDELVIRERK